MENLFSAARQRMEADLRGNILPFWMEHALDRVNGGYYGAITNDLTIDNRVPRSAVVTARILWTYSLAYRVYGDLAYLEAAQHAYRSLSESFWDSKNGGVYWTVDRQGNPANDRKHIYAQAFAIYGLSEYYRAAGDPHALELAQELFHLIETYSYDPLHGGNIECLSREWGNLADMRLSAKEPDARKTMNTLLHLMEADTNLLRVWPDPLLKIRQAGLIETFLEHVIDPQTGHFRLFFDDAWHSLSPIISYGHDIEGSWLLVEAAEVQGDPALLDRARQAGVRLAEAVFCEGLDTDGSVLYEADRSNPRSFDRHWWGQAEGLVGFYAAYQLSGREEFALAALRCWEVIDAHFIDRSHGDWFKILDRQGVPMPDQLKVGPWECPYHHARAYFEMLRRLPGSPGETRG